MHHCCDETIGQNPRTICIFLAASSTLEYQVGRCLKGSWQLHKLKIGEIGSLKIEPNQIVVVYHVR